MKTLGVLTLIALLSYGCSKTACPGFEKVEQGSGCRNTTNGEFADASNCNC